jgi:hypothetical protein
MGGLLADSQAYGQAKKIDAIVHMGDHAYNYGDANGMRIYNIYIHALNGDLQVRVVMSNQICTIWNRYPGRRVLGWVFSCAEIDSLGSGGWQPRGE